MRVAVYARVSTLDKGQDVGVQMRELRAYIVARGWTVVQEYVDEGVSGGKDSRPALDALLDDCRRRRVDVVVVWRLDRFGRSLEHLVGTVNELHGLGVGFVSLHENLDFTTATGKLMFHLLAAFAEFERALIGERVRAGLVHAREKGKMLGRPVRVLDPEKLQALVEKKLSVRAMARALKVSAGTVQKTLENLPR